MTTISYTLFLASIFFICRPAVDVVAEDPLGESGNEVSDDLSTANSVENEEQGLKQDLQDILVGQGLLKLDLQNLTENIGKVHANILERLEEVEDKLTERCTIDAHCRNVSDAPNREGVPGFRSCLELYDAGFSASDVYNIAPDGVHKTQVYCQQLVNGYGSGWTVFQRRINGTEDFYRNWYNYTHGFGNPEAEYWLGLNYLYHLTANKDTQLLVELKIGSETAYATYDFNIKDSTDYYKLNISGFSAGQIDPGDGLSYYNLRNFSTYDADHDLSGGSNCAEKYKGGFWYLACLDANLNGLYNVNNMSGMIWPPWYGLNSLSATMMMIRKK